VQQLAGRGGPSVRAAGLPAARRPSAGGAIPASSAYSGGVGSTPYLATELFKPIPGIDVVYVPYKGRRVPALAITSQKRSPRAPELPTTAEAGVPGYGPRSSPSS
jgi:tripartite-type tricarboxylate transporter receptor subunit TctC